MMEDESGRETVNSINVSKFSSKPETKMENFLARCKKCDIISLIFFSLALLSMDACYLLGCARLFGLPFFLRFYGCAISEDIPPPPRTLVRLINNCFIDAHFEH